MNENQNNELEELGSRLKYLEKQMDQLIHQLQELEIVKDGIKDIANSKIGNEILVPIGAGVFAKATLKDSDKVLMNVGSQIVVEKSSVDAEKLVADQIGELDQIKDKMQGELASLSNQIQLLQIQE
jgi:prefoldin alpha subunit